MAGWAAALGPPRAWGCCGGVGLGVPAHAHTGLVQTLSTTLLSRKAGVGLGVPAEGIPAHALHRLSIPAEQDATVIGYWWRDVSSES